MTKFIFTNRAEKVFSKLEQVEQNRILEKLKFLKNHNNIFSVIRKIYYVEPITHKLRVGNYRLLLTLIMQKNNEYEFIVNKIGHRREVYKTI